MMTHLIRPLLLVLLFNMMAVSYRLNRARPPLRTLMMVRSIHEPKEELASTTPKDELKKVKMTRRQRRRDKEGVGMPKGYGSQLAKYQLEKHTLSGLPSTEHSFTVLGIESSCDDTAAAVVRSDGTVLSNVVYSQHEIHEKFGGIVPNLAKGAHEENIEKAVQGAIESAGMTSIEDVDAIAVTKGPGLEVCLRVGFRKAQALARSSGKPFITVHHLEAHCMVARLAGERILREGANESAVVHEDCEKLDQEMKENSGSSSSPDTADLASGEDERHHFHMQPKVEFPFLTLLASGGHTSILLCKGMGEYSVLGGTLDDALGEAFDKASRLLGLRSASSGGLAVELEARKYVESQREGVDDSAFDESSVYPIKGYSYLKVPLRGKPTCDFSYSGLKNSFRMQVEQSRRTMLGSDGAGDDERTDAIAQATNAPAGQMEEAPKELVTLPSNETSALCAAFQDVAFGHVEDRIRRALDVIDNMQRGGQLTEPIKGLVVVGGVAANKELRRRLLNLLDKRWQTAAKRVTIARERFIEAEACQQRDIDSTTTDHHAEPNGAPQESLSDARFQYPPKLQLVFPPPKLCTDNGVMVAWTGIEKIFKGISDAVDGADAEVIARWPLGTIIEDPELFKKPILK